MSLRRQPETWPERFARAATTSGVPFLRDYYSAPMVDAQIPIDRVPLVAMDFETTGLDPNEHEIISVGLVPFTRQRIYCHQAVYLLFRPSRELHRESVVIHSLTHDTVTTAPSLTEGLQQLFATLRGRVPVVHCRQIEKAFLDQALRKAHAQTWQSPLIDTMDLERQALERRRGLLGRLLRRPAGSLRLDICRERYGLPVYSAHHALTDALATAELLLAQLAHHYPPQVPVGHIWV